MAIQFGEQATKPQGGRGRAAARGALVLVAGVLWAYALVGTEGIGRQKERMERREELRAQLASEQASNDQLRREVEALRTDDLAIEQAIRSELDYQKPGEIVLIIENDDPLGGAPRSRRSEVVAPPVPKELWDATAKQLGTTGAAPATAKSNVQPPRPAGKPERHPGPSDRVTANKPE